VITSGGGAAGLALAALGLRWMTAEAPASLAAAFGVLRPQALAWPVLVFAAAAMAATGLLAGLAPARWAARLDLRGAMQGSGTRDRRSYSWFVAGQTALALVLLASALLLLRSFGDLLSAPLGFRSQNLVNVSVILRTPENPQAAAGSAEHWWAAMAPWWGSLLRRVRALPAVAGAGVTSNLPLSPSNRAAGPTSELGLTIQPQQPGGGADIGTWADHGFPRLFADDGHSIAAGPVFWIAGHGGCAAANHSEPERGGAVVPASGPSWAAHQALPLPAAAVLRGDRRGGRYAADHAARHRADLV
jgi:hypothetical protein